MSPVISRRRVALATCLLAGVAALASSCSSSSPATPATPTTPATPAGPSTPTAACTYTLSPTSLSVGAAGGASTVSVTTQAACTWTAATTSPFIAIGSGASGTGSGSVVLNVAADPGGSRTGTVTVAGQTVTVTQTGAGIIVAFDMFDPPSQAGPVTTCRIRGVAAGSFTTCPITTTSRTTGSNTLVNWSWTVQYTYDGVAKTQTQNTGSIQDFSFYEFCGSKGSSVEGTTIPMTVSLTVTDSNGVQATATSGTGNQPALSFIAFSCGV